MLRTRNGANDLFREFGPLDHAGDHIVGPLSLAGANDLHALEESLEEPLGNVALFGQELGIGRQVAFLEPGHDLPRGLPADGELVGLQGADVGAFAERLGDGDVGADAFAVVAEAVVGRGAIAPAGGCGSRSRRRRGCRCARKTCRQRAFAIAGRNPWGPARF